MLKGRQVELVGIDIRQRLILQAPIRPPDFPVIADQRVGLQVVHTILQDGFQPRKRFGQALAVSVGAHGLGDFSLQAVNRENDMKSKT